MKCKKCKKCKCYDPNSYTCNIEQTKSNGEPYCGILRNEE